MLALASSWHAVGLMPTLRALARTDTVGANRYFLISLGANRYFPYLRSVQGVQGPFNLFKCAPGIKCAPAYAFDPAEPVPGGRPVDPSIA